MKHYSWVRQNKTSGLKGWVKGYSRTALNQRDKEHEDRLYRARKWLSEKISPDKKKRA